MCCFAGKSAPRDPLLTMEVLYQLSYVGGPRILAVSGALPTYASSAEAAWNLPIV